LVFDSGGNLFVSDNAAGTITKIAPDGTRTIFANDLANPQELAIEPALLKLLNISTRMQVLTGENVLIAGFIITGTAPKQVLIRGLGPELPVSGQLADPYLELHEGDNLLGSNNNWQDSQADQIRATGIPPTNDLESAIVATLMPGSYTAILSGKDSGTGIGQVEVYDLSQSASSQLANISTRGYVDTGDNVMIGGVIVSSGPAGATARVLLRAIGPSLAATGVMNPLADPTLELHDSNGQTLATNDNWKDTQPADIQATGIPPNNDNESAIVAVLAPGNYTAVVRGKAGTTGVGLVEIYNLH
jgi:hypothetical protein